MNTTCGVEHIAMCVFDMHQTLDENLMLLYLT